MISPLEYTVNRISTYYSTSEKSIAQGLENISSGIYFRKPKDGVSEFMSIQKSKNSNRMSDIVKADLERGKSILTVAEEAGSRIADDLTRMKELITMYWDDTSSGTEKDMYESEFESLAADINTIVNETYYDDRQLIAEGTVTTLMNSSSDVTSSMDISYDSGEIVDASPGAMSIDEGGTEDASKAAWQAEYDKAMSYLAKTSGYLQSVSSHIAIGTSIKENQEAHISAVNGINDAQEISNMTKRSIRKEAALSMISQGNMHRMSVLKLIE